MIKKYIYNIIIIIIIIIIAFSLFKIYSILSDYKIGESAYSEVQRKVVTEQKNSSDNAQSLEYNVNFDELKKINSDIVGWIIVDGTNISYPIVQAEDNKYYLNRLFTKEINSAGCIFLDCNNSNDFSDMHTIIYGHNMKNDTMFGQLDKFKSQDFYNQFKTAKLITPNSVHNIDIFAGYVAKTDDDIWNLDIDLQNFDTWIKEIKSKSLFTSDISLSQNDKIITLATCSYEFNDARFVLVGTIN